MPGEEPGLEVDEPLVSPEHDRVGKGLAGVPLPPIGVIDAQFLVFLGIEVLDAAATGQLSEIRLQPSYFWVLAELILEFDEVAPRQRQRLDRAAPNQQTLV